MLKYKSPWIKREQSKQDDTQEKSEEVKDGQDFSDKSGTYLPCVPSLDMIVTPNEEESTSTPIDIVANALVKCAAAEGAEMEGYASGKRSAIICDANNDWIRLKGCGNLDQGFPLEPMPCPEASDEVRGCQFANTAYREMYF